MAKEFPCELISWNQVYRLTRQLAQKITSADFSPEVVIAIARGGFVPARIICDFFSIGELASIRIVHYTAGATEQKTRLVAPLNISVKGKRVLVVDDIIDSGDTLVLAMEHLHEAGAKEIKTAVMQCKKSASFTPDFLARRIIKWRWVIYPWAVIEDLRGFLLKKKLHPLSPAAAKMFFEKNYDLHLPESILKDVISTF